MLTILLIFTSVSATAKCPELFFDGQEPKILNANVASLCFTQFAVAESVTYKTPIYAAEHLTAKDVYLAHTIKRKDAFHEEERLPLAARSLPSDYKRSNYHKGHLFPAGNAATMKNQWESFSMSNMIPQTPVNNTKIWAAIEETARDLAVSEGDIYIVTGPIYSDKPNFLHNRVGVPTLIFKAIYIPSTKETAVYITKNDSSLDYKIISVDKLIDLTGLDPFPSLGANLKAVASTLPDPTNNIPTFDD